jgi:hypothetical protein
VAHPFDFRALGYLPLPSSTETLSTVRISEIGKQRSESGSGKWCGNRGAGQPGSATKMLRNKGFRGHALAFEGNAMAILFILIHIIPFE